jgi:hypothetical protein
MRTRLLTFAVGVLAVVAVAWFALGIRQAHDTTAAAAIVTGTSPLAPSQARHVSGLLHSAGELNPDTQVDVLRGELDLGQGERVAARRILERVTAQEPDNALAWEWLARASLGDLREFYVAAYQIRLLVPPVR